MKRIHKLSETLVSQIAAGEVIESPAAIVKELVENSIDAGAVLVDIRIQDDGFGEIQVRDDGHGISAEDLPLAVESFATSKIRSLEELLAAGTMGFRGEALGSIASVSRLTIESRERGAAHGEAIVVDERGKTTAPSPIETGTRVVVRDLFYNVPVRRDYFANAARVRKDLTTVILNLAIAHFATSFAYQMGENDRVSLPARASLMERLQDIWGESIAGDLLPVYEHKGKLELSGYMSKFYFYRNQAADCRFWVNNRPVFYKPLISLLRAAYGELMPKGRFPFTALFLTLPTTEVDVNVHPQKREVRFRHEADVLSFLRSTLTRTVSAEGGISAASMVCMPVAGMTRRDAEGQSSNANSQTKTGTTGDLFSVPLAIGPIEEGSEKEQALSFPERLVYHSRLFNTFVIATNEEALYLIDQHTVHERINYERQLELIAARGAQAQKLATPLALPLSLFERVRVEANITRLGEIGFEVEDLGPAGFALVAVPDFVAHADEVGAFSQALDLAEDIPDCDAAELFDQLAKDLSCRFAIKKGESASLTDFAELMERLRACRNPMRCPHGRPTIVRIDEKEIFAYFKRMAV